MIKKFCSCMLSAIFCFGGNIVFAASKNVTKVDKYENNTSNIKVINKNANSSKKANKKSKKNKKTVCNKKNIKSFNENLKVNSNKQKKSNFSDSMNGIWDKIYDNRGVVISSTNVCLDLLSNYLVAKKSKGKDWKKFLEQIDELTKFLSANGILFRSNDFDMYVTNCYVRTEGLLNCLDENTRNNIDNNFKMKILITLVRVGFFKLIDEIFKLNVYDGHSFPHICKALISKGDDMMKQNVAKDKNNNKIHVILTKENIEQEIECAENYIKKMSKKFENILFSDFEERFGNILNCPEYRDVVENFRFELLAILRSDDEISQWVKSNLKVYK